MRITEADEKRPDGPGVFQKPGRSPGLSLGDYFFLAAAEAADAAAAGFSAAFLSSFLGASAATAAEAAKAVAIRAARSLFILNGTFRKLDSPPSNREATLQRGSQSVG